MIKKDAKRYTDFCHFIEGSGSFSPWLDDYDPFTEDGFAFVHTGSEDNGQFGLGDLDLYFKNTNFSYQDILKKVQAYRDECKQAMDSDVPEEVEYVESLDDLVRDIQDWCDKNESTKSEGVGGKIKMGIDYNMFMRMCASAAYLDENEDYWDALWEYYSEMGEIEDACEFFDNLFQYTSWCDEDEVYDEYLDDSYKDGTKSKAECIEAAVDAGDLNVFKTDKGYLVIQ